jgi:hypothetical protein
MLYPERLAYDVFRFSNALAHLTRGVKSALPDVPAFNTMDNARARSLYNLLRIASIENVNLAEIILAQIKEYYDAEELDNIRRSGDANASPRVQGT